MAERKSKKDTSKRKTTEKKNDLYSGVLDEAERLDYELASEVNGIDDEIALLRVKIKSVLESDPENIRLIMQATNTLARLVKTRYNITGKQGKGLRDAIRNVLTEVALPMGISIGADILGK